MFLYCFVGVVSVVDVTVVFVVAAVAAVVVVAVDVTFGVAAAVILFSSLQGSFSA